MFVDNDFSYAAGARPRADLQLRQPIISNRFVENAICGIWGGYSQGTLIARQHLRGQRRDGVTASSAAAINIEHGSGTESWQHLQRQQVRRAPLVGRRQGLEEALGRGQLPGLRNLIAGNTFDHDADRDSTGSPGDHALRKHDERRRSRLDSDAASTIVRQKPPSKPAGNLRTGPVRDEGPFRPNSPAARTSS